MKISIPPNNPPLTAREVLQLLFGEPHAGPRHGVSLWCSRRVAKAEKDGHETVLYIRCACGKLFRVDEELCQASDDESLRTHVYIVEEALVSAPSAESWGAF